MARGPSVLNDVQTQRTIMINVWMENFRCKSYTRGLFGIILPKYQPQTEYTTFPRGFIGTKNRGGPNEEIGIGNWARTAPLRRLVDDGFEIGHEPKLRRGSHDEDRMDLLTSEK